MYATPSAPLADRRRSAALARALAVSSVLAVAAAGAAEPAGDLPLPPPPPPPSAPAIPLPPPPAGTALQPQPAAPPAAEKCTGCHSPLTRGRVVHGALQMGDCTDCHQAVTATGGKCRSRTASKWSLVKAEPDLCYGCHDRKDKTKFVHSALGQGGCLSCHTAHSSDNAALLSKPRETLCLECHDVEPLLTKAVRHAPVAEGQCLGCHDPHGGSVAKNLRATAGKPEFCLKCHDAKAPAGRGTPGPAFRVDLSKKTVHPAIEMGDCTDCHDRGHGSDNRRLLKKSAAALCYGCHDRKDKNKFPHGAVLSGDCAVCHDPHSSNNPKLLAKAPIQQTCFLCHQDDLTGRKVIHPPVEMGCDECHDPHGAQARSGLKFGEGKATCYHCHQPVDTGKVKHAALQRYGCTGCHDPHGAANGAMIAKGVNALCLSCHEAQRDGKHVTPIASGGHVLGDGKLVDPKREGRTFSCASCHNPHGSDSPKLLRVGATPMESCAWCHGDKTGKRPDLKDVASQAHPKPATTGAGGGAGSGGSSGSGGGETGNAR